MWGTGIRGLRMGEKEIEISVTIPTGELSTVDVKPGKDHNSIETFISIPAETTVYRIKLKGTDDVGC
jgi:hypothetical protein